MDVKNTRRPLEGGERRQERGGKTPTNVFVTSPWGGQGGGESEEESTLERERVWIGKKGENSIAAKNTAKHSPWSEARR